MISSLSHCLESNRRSSQQVRSWKLKQTPFHILFFPPCIVHRVARVHRVSPLRDIDLFASGNQETATVPIKRSAIRFDRVVIQPLATKLRPPNRNMYMYIAQQHPARRFLLSFLSLLSLSSGSRWKKPVGIGYLPDWFALAKNLNKRGSSVSASARHYRNYLSLRPVAIREPWLWPKNLKGLTRQRCVWKFEGAGLRTLPRLSRLEILR